MSTVGRPCGIDSLQWCMCHMTSDLASARAAMHWFASLKPLFSLYCRDIRQEARSCRANSRLTMCFCAAVSHAWVKLPTTMFLRLALCPCLGCFLCFRVCFIFE